jgi:hypothetical protein
MMRRLVPLLAAVALAAPVPAGANNDPRVPADECSGNPNVVGQPQSHGGTNAVDIGPSPIAAPASVFNASDVNQGFPGNAQSPGAQGTARSEATAHCNP